MEKVVKTFIVCALTLILGACSLAEAPAPNGESSTTQEENSQQEDTTVDSHSSETSQEEPVTEEFPPQIEESIEIEGMEDLITLNLYNYDDAPFITYVPTDIIVGEASGGEGDAYFFYANYENQKIEDIYLQVYLFAEHVTEEPSDEEDGTLAEFLEGMECVPPEQELYKWSLKEYQSPEGSRHAMLGEHNGQYFVMIINSSPLYSGGFIPRVNKIIEHFYWKDTQDYLETDTES